MIDGSALALRKLHHQGVSVWFVTNNSNKPPSHYLDRLEDADIPHGGQMITSAQAAASLVERDERVLICAGPGVHQAVLDVGALPIENSAELRHGDVAAVVVGLHTDFDYARLDRAARSVRAGARLIGTNSDVTFPTANGEAPGGGSILAAVEAASGQRAILAGKPNLPMANVLRQRIGAAFDPATSVMVGDRYSTDGRFAERLGCRFLAVSTGVTPDDDDVAVWRRVSCLEQAVPILNGAR